MNITSKHLRKVSLVIGLLSIPLMAGGSPSSALGQVTIDFWHAMEGPKATVMNEMGKDFIKENPGIKLNVSLQGSYTDMVRKIQAGIAANALPDVAMLGQRHGIPHISDSGRLLVLDSVLTPEDRKDISPHLFGRYTYKGRLMAMPFAISTPVLHLNATRLKEAGLNPDKPPTTWEELLSYARRLTRDVDGDGRIDHWGFNFHNDLPWHVCAFIYQNGGAIYGTDGKAKLDSIEVIQAIQFLSDLVHRHKVTPPLAHEGASKLFTAGNLAMFQRSSAFIEGAAKQIGKRFDYRVAYLPKGKVYAVPDGGGGLGVLKSTPEREKAALAFLKWMTGTKGIARFSRETGYITFRKSSAELKEMKEFFAQNPREHVAAEQMEYVRSNPVNHADGAVWDGLGKLMEKVEVDPKADVSALLRDLNAKVNREIAERAR
ncbi:MAG: ABC transporter substrate-binding protein [Candidatus Binatia bacterium]